MPDTPEHEDVQQPPAPEPPPGDEVARAAWTLSERERRTAEAFERGRAISRANAEKLRQRAPRAPAAPLPPQPEPMQARACPAACGGSYVPLAGVAALCDACLATREAERAATATAHATARREAERAAMLAALAVPEDYRDASVENFDVTVLGQATPAARRTLERAQAWAARYVELWPARRRAPGFPRVAVFSGAPGTGKDRMGYAIALDVLRAHPETTMIVRKLSEIVRDLREPWGRRGGDPKGDGENARLAHYHRPALLVIKEVTPRLLHGADSMVKELYELIEPRENDGRPTILTTNLRPAELAAAGEETVERFFDAALTSRAGRVWDFGALDYRAVRDEQDGDAFFRAPIMRLVAAERGGRA